VSDLLSMYLMQVVAVEIQMALREFSAAKLHGRSCRLTSQGLNEALRAASQM
jgi:hypothetical protein